MAFVARRETPHTSWGELTGREEGKKKTFFLFSSNVFCTFAHLGTPVSGGVGGGGVGGRHGRQ